MVSTETPSENSACAQIYLQFVWVIKSPTVIHSVLQWDFFYWPNSILLPLKSKMPLQALSDSTNNYHFNEYKCRFVSKCSAKAWISKIQL